MQSGAVWSWGLGEVIILRELTVPLKKKPWAGEMAQWLRALTALPEDLGFNSQHPHGSSQLSVTLVPGDLTPMAKHHCT